MDRQWVSFRLCSETHAFAIQHVREMLRMPDVHPLPDAGPDALGVMLLRGQVIPVFDLRVTLGMPGCMEAAGALAGLLQERLRDHENWLAELERSVRERRDFTLTTDPHKCKFGMWYDQYRSDDPWLASQLRLFDQPHRQIHSVGKQVCELIAAQRVTEAQALVHDCRNTVLSALTQLFQDTIRMVWERSRPCVVVLNLGSRVLGVAVDEMRSVIRSGEDEIQLPESLTSMHELPGLIGFLRQRDSQRLITLLDPGALYANAAVPVPME